MNILQIGFHFDDDLESPEALLARCPTLTGWSEALAAAGATSVRMVQRFRADACVVRRGIEYRFCGAAGGVLASAAAWWPKLARAVHESAPDIAHVNGLNAPRETWLLRRVLPRETAIVVQDHGSLPRGTGQPVGGLAAAARRAAFGAADGFLFTASGQAEPWRRAGQIGRNQVVYEVMEASTTLRPVPAAAAKHASGVAGSPAVLWVGRLNANKDPLTVLEGFERSVAALPDARLTMVFGADDLLAAVRERVSASAALASRVRLVGRVPHDLMPAFYSAADIFVLGSGHEGSGYALIEACACGASPVVTDIPPFRAITRGSIGALWAPGDAGACARALGDVAGRDRRVERGRVLGHFARAMSWRATGRRAMAIYADAVERRRAATRPVGDLRVWAPLPPPPTSDAGP